MYDPHDIHVVDDEPDAFMRRTGALASIVAQAVAVGLRRAWSSEMFMVAVRHEKEFVYIRGLLPVRRACLSETGFRRLVTRTVEQIHPYACVTDLRSDVRLQFFDAHFRLEVARA